RRTPTRTLMARVYQPNGAGPFPVLLDLHGGAWNNQDRKANAPMDESLASSGILVVAIDLTLAPEAPYPASVQDANYGVRWLKHKAREWNGDPETIGALGSSSGGHVVELCAMRPHDSYYSVHTLGEAPELDANVLPAVQEKFVTSYRAAGGECQYEVFAGCEHLWIREPGPQTDRAYDTLKTFIARQLSKKRLAA